jgi:hypothetical protein
MLGRDERDAVLGDLIEAGEGTWQALRAVLGLVMRREALFWKMGRPWIAAFGLSLPCSFLLMGVSISLSRAFLDVLAASHGFAGHPPGSPWLSAIPQALLLLGWSWTGGFVASLVSRRTLWVSTLCCLLPCMFCLFRFRMESLSPFCLFLFLLPAVWGASHGLRIGRMTRAPAILLAVAVTLLVVATLRIHGEPGWRSPQNLSAIILTWPAWYLAAISKPRQQSDTQKLERFADGGETR